MKTYLAVGLCVVFGWSAAALAGPTTFHFETAPNVLHAVVTPTGAGTADMHVASGFGPPPLGDLLFGNILGGPPGVTFGSGLGDAFSVGLDLALTDQGTEWTAEGTLTVNEDTAGHAGSPSIVAHFKSFSVGLVESVVGSTLKIEGNLSGIGGAPILVNRDSGADDWTWTDSSSNTVTVTQASSFDLGELLSFQFGAVDPSQFSSEKEALDSLFSTADTLVNGQLKGNIIPTPSALLLAGLGLVVSRRIRRRRRRASA